MSTKLSLIFCAQNMTRSKDIPIHHRNILCSRPHKRTIKINSFCFDHSLVCSPSTILSDQKPNCILVQSFLCIGVKKFGIRATQLDPCSPRFLLPNLFLYFTPFFLSFEVRTFLYQPFEHLPNAEEINFISHVVQT